MSPFPRRPRRPVPGRTARRLLHLIPTEGVTASQAGDLLSDGTDAASGLRSLRRHGLAINRDALWLLTPKGAGIRQRLAGLPP